MVSEQRTSGVGSNRSFDWATITAQLAIFYNIIEWRSYEHRQFCLGYSTLGTKTASKVSTQKLKIHPKTNNLILKPKYLTLRCFLTRKSMWRVWPNLVLTCSAKPEWSWRGSCRWGRTGRCRWTSRWCDATRSVRRWSSRRPRQEWPGENNHIMVPI